MSTFENPSNGYKVEITRLASLWALLFGIFYFLFNGLWTHVLIQAFITIAVIGGFGPPGILLMSVVWIGYAVAAPAILANKYRALGWREVGTGMEAATRTLPTRKAADEKVCPRCAETVKAAARVCRFCGHEFGAAGDSSVNGKRWVEGEVVYHPKLGQGCFVRQENAGLVRVRFSKSELSVAASELL